NLYLVEQVSPSNPLSILTVNNVKDAQGATTSGIIGITATDGGRSGVFAAVKPSNSSNFGTIGSGIALIQLEEKKVDEGDKKINKLFFGQVAADPSQSQIAA